MSFLDFLNESKFKFTHKQILVVVLCLLFLQLNCAEASGEEEEEEDIPSEPIHTDYSNPKEVNSLTELPNEIIDNTYTLPNNQFKPLGFTRPKKNGKNKLFFKSRNSLFGDFSSIASIPFPNLWYFLFLMKLVFSPKQKRQRRRLQDQNLDVSCRNSDSVEKKNTSVDDPQNIDFTCESDQDFSGNEDDFNIKISEIGGQDPPDYLGDMNLMDLPDDINDVHYFVVTGISSFNGDTIDFDGSGSDGISKIKVPQFSPVFTQPQDVTATCSFDGTKVTCKTSREITAQERKTTGLIFSTPEPIQLDSSGNVISKSSRRRMATVDQTLTISTNEQPVVDTNSDSEQILRGSNKSSGLSGGAIAGIVIACAAVLIGGILAALLCRKTTTSTALYTTTQDNLAIEQKPVYY